LALQKKFLNDKVSNRDNFGEDGIWEEAFMMNFIMMLHLW
jgi:hypothetical protein